MAREDVGLDRTVRWLLDTNVVVWALHKPDELSVVVRDALHRRTVSACYSAAVVWELAIKQATGKLPYRADQIAEELKRLGFVEIPITARHGLAAGRLPRHHNDPFDRIMIAQAIAEDLVLVSRDGLFRQYGVRLLQS